MKGKQIKSLSELVKARERRESVIVPSDLPCTFGSPRPAAFMLNLSGEMLHGLFKKGMYIYEKSGG